MHYERMYENCRGLLTKCLCALMLLTVLCATSCRTKKRTAQSSSTAIAAAHTDSTRAVSEVSQTAKVDETWLEFSAPDSAGRTHVTRLVRRRTQVAADTRQEATKVTADSTRTEVRQERTSENTGANPLSKAVVVIGSIVAAAAVALAMIWKIKH